MVFRNLCRIDGAFAAKTRKPVVSLLALLSDSSKFVLHHKVNS